MKRRRFLLGAAAAGLMTVPWPGTATLVRTRPWFLSAHATPGEGHSACGRGLSPLSTGESRIAKLLAAGHTTREIATRLGRSERTVQVNVSVILQKLDLHRRSQIVEWVTVRRARSELPPL